MQCCLLKLALSSRQRGDTLWKPAPVLATAKLPGRGVGAALTLSRAVPLLLLKDGEGECLFSAVVMERNGLPTP